MDRKLYQNPSTVKNPYRIERLYQERMRRIETSAITTDTLLASVGMTREHLQESEENVEFVSAPAGEQTMTVTDTITINEYTNPEKLKKDAEEALRDRYIEFAQSNTKDVTARIDRAWRIKAGVYALGGVAFVAASAGTLGLGLTSIPMIMMVTARTAMSIDEVIVNGAAILPTLINNSANLAVYYLLSPAQISGYLNAAKIPGLCGIGLEVVISGIALDSTRRFLNMATKKLFYDQKTIEEMRIRQWMRNKIELETQFQGLLYRINSKAPELLPLHGSNISIDELAVIGSRMKLSDYDLTQLLGPYGKLEKPFLEQLCKVGTASGLAGALMDTISLMINSAANSSVSVASDPLLALLTAGATGGSIIWDKLIKPTIAKWIVMDVVHLPYMIDLLKKDLESRFGPSSPVAAEEVRRQSRWKVAFRMSWDFLWNSGITRIQMSAVNGIRELLSVPDLYLSTKFRGYCLYTQDAFYREMQKGTLDPLQIIKDGRNAIEHGKEIRRITGVDIDGPDAEISDLEQKSQGSLFGTFLSPSAIIGRRLLYISKYTKELEALKDVKRNIEERQERTSVLKNLVSEQEKHLDELKEMISNNDLKSVLDIMRLDVEERKILQEFQEQINPGTVSWLFNIDPTDEEWKKRLAIEISNPKTSLVAREYMERLQSLGFVPSYDKIRSDSVLRSNGLYVNPQSSYSFYSNPESIIAEIQIEGRIVEYVKTLESQIRDSRNDLAQFTRDTSQLQQSYNIYQSMTSNNLQTWFENAKMDKVMNGTFDVDFSFGFQPSNIESAEKILNQAKIAIAGYAFERGSDSQFPSLSSVLLDDHPPAPYSEPERILEYHEKELKMEIAKLNDVLRANPRSDLYSTSDTTTRTPSDIRTLRQWVDFQKSSLVSKRIAWIYQDYLTSQGKQPDRSRETAFALGILRNPLLYKRVTGKEIVFPTPDKIESTIEDAVQNIKNGIKTALEKKSGKSFFADSIAQVRWWGVDHSRQVAMLFDFDKVKIAPFSKIEDEFLRTVEWKRYSNANDMLGIEDDISTLESKLLYIGKFNVGMEKWLKVAASEDTSADFLPFLDRLKHQPSKNLSPRDLDKMDRLIHTFRREAFEAIKRLQGGGIPLAVAYLIGEREKSSLSLVQQIGIALDRNRSTNYGFKFNRTKNIRGSFANYTNEVFRVPAPEDAAGVINLDNAIQDIFTNAMDSGVVFDHVRSSIPDLENKESYEYINKTGNPLTSYFLMMEAAMCSVTNTGTDTCELLARIKSEEGLEMTQDSSIDLGELAWKLARSSDLPSAEEVSLLENGQIDEKSIRSSTDAAKVWNMATSGTIYDLKNTSVDLDPEVMRTLLFGRNGSIVRHYYDRYLERITKVDVLYGTYIPSEMYANFDGSVLGKLYKGAPSGRVALEKLNSQLFGLAKDDQADDLTMFGIDDPYNRFYQGEIVPKYQHSLYNRFLTTKSKLSISTSSALQLGFIGMTMLIKNAIDIQSIAVAGVSLSGL